MIDLIHLLTIVIFFFFSTVCMHLFTIVYQHFLLIYTDTKSRAKINCNRDRTIFQKKFLDFKQDSVIAMEESAKSSKSKKSLKRGECHP